MVESAVHDLISPANFSRRANSEKIVNVNDLLEELIQQSVSLVAAVALMNKGQGAGHRF